MIDVYFALHSLQYGPPGGGAPLLQYLWILLIITIPIVILVVYRLLFPNLQRVKVEDPISKIAPDVPHVKDDVSNVTELTQPPTSTQAAGGDPHSIDLALRLMNANEKKIMEALLAAQGSMLQKDISAETGFSRVKTHRVLTRLIQRGVVSAEKYYNTNRITLAEWLLENNE